MHLIKGQANLRVWILRGKGK